MAFPSNNVVVLMETPRLPEAVVGEGGEGDSGCSTAAPHVFLRGHTDRVTRVELSNSGHLLASAQGDVLGAAGEKDRCNGARVAMEEGEGCCVDTSVNWAAR